MPAKKLKIGITGGIGSGKSLASMYFEKLGYKVIYADKIARELYRTNKLLLKKLVKVFGNGILDENGKLSRANSRKIIFKSKKNLSRVNSIVHPFVFSEMDRLVKKTKDRIILFEAAIMFESGSYKRMDYVVLIYANKETRVKRILKRDEVKRKDILNLMKLQIDEKEKAKRADFIIKNNSNTSELNKNIKAFNKILKRL
ncbi:MAG: dephospho-CoA kinase [Ignavibacteria bacterium]